jgi:hypothetical protein
MSESEELLTVPPELIFGLAFLALILVAILTIIFNVNLGGLTDAMTLLQTFVKNILSKVPLYKKYL